MTQKKFLTNSIFTIFLFLAFLFFSINFLHVKPKICSEDCGTVDVNNDFIFQAHTITGYT